MPIPSIGAEMTHVVITPEIILNSMATVNLPNKRQLVDTGIYGGVCHAVLVGLMKRVTLDFLTGDHRAMHEDPGPNLPVYQVGRRGRRKEGGAGPSRRCLFKGGLGNLYPHRHGGECQTGFRPGGQAVP